VSSEKPHTRITASVKETILVNKRFLNKFICSLYHIKSTSEVKNDYIIKRLESNNYYQHLHTVIEWQK